MTLKIILGTSILVFSLLWVGLVSAATPSIYLEVPSVNIAPGSEFQVRILIDSKEPLNAYSINFGYSADFLELTGFDNSRSIIDIWQSQPVVSQNGSMKIIGGSLQPFQGQGGEVLAINFRAIAEGQVVFSFWESSVYLANGKGTKVIPQLKNLEMNIQSGGEKIQATIKADSTPPEIKILSLTPDPIRPDRKILGFLVQDVGSGVKETMLRSRRWLWWNEWQTAINPTAFINGVWSIDFRVVDNSGNASEKTLYDWKAFLRYFLPFWVALFVLVLVVTLKLVKKGRKSYNSK